MITNDDQEEVDNKAQNRAAEIMLQFDEVDIPHMIDNTFFL